MAGKELSLAIAIGGRLDASLGAAINSAERQLAGLGKNTNTSIGGATAAAERQLSGVVNRVNSVATAATTAALAGGAAVVVDSTKKAVEYESAMAGVAKVIDECRDANGKLTDTYYDLSDGILDMSTKIPMAAGDIASIVEAAGQAGVPQDELLGFAESAAKMGIAFDTTAEQAGGWMAQWRASMQLTQPQVEALADQINYLGNTTSEKAVKLAEVVSRVGALGQIAGLSGGEVAALAAAMPGVEAEIAATGIKNLAKAMTAGDAATKRQHEVLSQLGFDAGELAERMQVDAKGAILDFLSAIKQLPEAEQSAALTRFFGSESVAAISPLLANLGNLEEQFNKVGDSSQYAGSMQKEYEAIAGTTQNKIQLLANTIEKEQIKLGQEIMPAISEAAERLAERMPELFEIFADSLNNVIPAAVDMIDLLIDHADEILTFGTNFVKFFAGFKLASGALKGIKGIVSIFSTLSTVAKSVSAFTMLESVIGIIAKLASSVTPILAVAGAIVAVAKALSMLHDVLSDYSRGMSETAAEIGEATENLIKYNNIASEVEELRLIINSPDSSAEAVAAAEARLDEIAAMLSQEHNLVINADTSELEAALNMSQQLSRTELINSATDLTAKAQNGAEQYKEDVARLPNLEAEQKIAQEMQVIYSELVSSAELYRSSFDGGLSTQEEYMSNMDALYQRAKEAGIEFQYIGENLDEYSIDSFITALSGGLQMANMQLSNANRELSEALQRTGEYGESIEQAGNYLTQALASDVKAGNAFGTDTDIDMLTQLGESMVAAGIQTDTLAVSFAAAKSGYADFAEAIAGGKAGEMAQSFIEYKTAIGETAASAVPAAALIQNGFKDVEQATAAGGDAITAVIADMQRLGSMHGLFDGITSIDGVAGKLTDIAHAMGLIPENKAISINADGNIDIVQEAENQIASIKSQGNVDVSINANGDISIYDEVTQKTSVLQNMGAVSMAVNAQGNIDVLTEAGEVIATIDSKSAHVTVNADGNAQTVAQATQDAVVSIPDSKQLFLGATPDAHMQAVLTNAAIQQIPDSKIIPFRATGNAYAMAASIGAAIRRLPTSKTITINIRTNGSIPQVASGIRNAPAGVYMVNDQNIADPREVIEHNGLRYWYEGRNVITTLPRGANVYTATESRAYIDGSHRNGLHRVPFDGYIAELHRNERILTDDEAEDYRNSGIFARAVDRLRYTRSERDRSERSGNSGSYTISYNPTIIIEGNADEATVSRAIRQGYEDFKNYMERYERDKRRTSFSA